MSPDPPRVVRLVGPDGQHVDLSGWPRWESWARSNCPLYRLADAVARSGGYGKLDRHRLLVHAHVLRNVEPEAERALLTSKIVQFDVSLMRGE